MGRSFPASFQFCRHAIARLPAIRALRSSPCTWQTGQKIWTTSLQNYKRGLNETAFLADTTFCCLMEIDSCCSRSNVAQHRMCADGQQARSAIGTVEDQRRRE